MAQHRQRQLQRVRQPQLPRRRGPGRPAAHARQAQAGPAAQPAHTLAQAQQGLQLCARETEEARGGRPVTSRHDPARHDRRHPRRDRLPARVRLRGRARPGADLLHLRQDRPAGRSGAEDYTDRRWRKGGQSCEGTRPRGGHGAGQRGRGLGHREQR